MSRGRPPSWNPLGDLDPGTWTEVAEFGTKGRFGIPIAARRRLSWFERGVTSGFLATLEAGGMAELKPWAEFGEDTLDAVRDIVGRAIPAQRSEIALAAMDRYMFVNIEENGRLVVPANLIAHVDPAGFGKARVVVMQDSLWLWSESAWQAARSSRLELLVNPPSS